MLNSFAQSVMVEDQSTGERIENVAIFSIDKTQSIITDNEGKADITDFDLSKIIIFQINGYKTLSTKLSDTKKSFLIQLEPNIQNLEGLILSVARSKTNKNKIAE